MKRYWLSVAAVLAGGAVISLVTARRTEAQAYSTPVRVVNPASGPALTTRTDDPGRAPFQANGTCTGVGQPACEVTLAPIPAGNRLIFQQVSGVLHAIGDPSQLAVFLGATHGLFNLASFALNPPPALDPVGQANNTFFFQNVAGYVDGPDSVTITVHVNNSLSGSPSANVTLIGYLLDCSVAPCATIAP